jgi:hypothetical protein
MSVLAVAASCFLCGMSCSNNTTAVSGGGTDVSNARVSGMITTAAGNGVASAEVKLIPVSYLPYMAEQPRPVYTDTTDSNGTYVFRDIKAGTYNIQAVHLTKRTRLLRQNVVVGDNDSQIVADDSLRAPGSVAVILLPTRLFLPGGFLFVPGTDISVRITSISSCGIMDSVPAGSLATIAYSDASGGDSYIPLSHDVDVRPGRSSAGGTVFCLLVTGESSVRSPADSLIAERLRSIGVTAVPKPGSAVIASDTTGMDFVLVSPAASPANLRFLKTAPVSMVVCQTRAYPLLDMTGQTAGVDYGVYAKGTIDYTDSVRRQDIEMRDVNHPISPGIAGTQVICSDSVYMVWGVPTLKSKYVASVYGDIYKLVIFTYDIGEQMNSIPAAARRVGLSFNEDVFPGLNSLGWMLFDNSIYWALRMR